MDQITCAPCDSIFTSQQQLARHMQSRNGPNHLCTLRQYFHITAATSKPHAKMSRTKSLVSTFKAVTNPIPCNVCDNIMYVCMYVCMPACMFVCMYVCMHIYVCMFIHECMDVRSDVYTCMHVCMHGCLSVYM